MKLLLWLCQYRAQTRVTIRHFTGPALTAMQLLHDIATIGRHRAHIAVLVQHELLRCSEHKITLGALLLPAQ